MKDYGIVQSTVAPHLLVVDEKSVWISEDVQLVTIDDDQGQRTEYSYHLMQYSKDEYIALLSNKNKALEQDLTDTQLALCDVYEMLL